MEMREGGTEEERGGGGAYERVRYGGREKDCKNTKHLNLLEKSCQWRGLWRWWS